MTLETNWDTEQVDLIIDNNEPLYLAKQKLLWKVTYVTPFIAQRFVREWRPALENEFRICRTQITWSDVKYDVLAKTWTEEIYYLKPRTPEQARHVGEALAAKHQAEMPIPDDQFRDMSPFKALGKALGSSFEFDCATLAICAAIGVDLMYIKLPMPSDYNEEGEQIAG